MVAGLVRTALGLVLREDPTAIKGLPLLLLEESFRDALCDPASCPPWFRTHRPGCNWDKSEDVRSANLDLLEGVELSVAKVGMSNAVLELAPDPEAKGTSSEPPMELRPLRLLFVDRFDTRLRLSMSLKRMGVLAVWLLVGVAELPEAPPPPS